MDLFEKAHLVKKTTQVSKAEQNTKKKLRQMLYGYRNNDPKAIKRSAEQTVDLTVDDDYTSYSEAELGSNTNIESSQESSGEPNNLEIEELDKTVPETGLNSEDNTSTDETSPNDADNASISELNDEIMSLPEESDSDQNSSSKIYGDEGTSSDVQTVDSTESSQFDGDGGLAAKILSKLEKRQKERQFIPRKKIKLSHLKDLVNNWSIEDVDHNPIPNPDVVDISCQTSHDDFVFDHQNDGLNDQNDVVNNQNDIFNNQNDISDNTEEVEPEKVCKKVARKKKTRLPTTPPPPQQYVVYQAQDFEDKPLSEIMRGYNFSTIAKPASHLVIVPEAVDNVFPAELADHSDLNSDYSDERDDYVPPPAPVELDLDEEILPEEFLEDPRVFDEDIEEVRSNQDEEPAADSEADIQSPEIDSRDPLSLYYTKNTCIVIMKHPAKLYIHGKVMAQLLGGAANIHGYSLQQEPCKIYAPNYNHAQYIETIENQNNYYGLFGKLTSTGLSVAETEDIVTSLGEYDVILHLTPLKSNSMDFVENNYSVAELFSKPSKYISELLKQASEMLGCSLYVDKPPRCFIEKKDWTHVARFCNEPNSRGIVCGGKNTGKSTFLRYYVNRCLANGPVLVIDLDPGQSEFTVAGSVSATVVTEPLLGPNFTHLKQPDLMLNIGMISVMDNLTRYTRAISDVFAHCYANKQYEGMPWIINTMGMCNKVGLKLITYIILIAKPMFIMQLDSKNPKKRYECYLNAHAVQNIYDSFKEKRDPLFRNIYASPEDFDFNLYLSHEDIDSDVIKTNFALAARDERYLNFLAYFGGVVDNRKSSSLLAVVPYVVQTQALKIASNVKFNEEAAYKVLNGKVVALCQQSPEDRTARIFTLQDKPMHCHGHALIRGIDMELGYLYIVTPEPVDRLCLVETMLYADWVPELRIETSLPEGTTVPFRTSTLHIQRQLMFTPKRRFNPIQYLKSRNT